MLTRVVPRALMKFLVSNTCLTGVRDFFLYSIDDNSANSMTNTMADLTTINTN